LIVIIELLLSALEKILLKLSFVTCKDFNAGLRIKLFAPGEFKSALDQKLPLSADSI
jgi:hypothetical protein